MGKRKTKHYTDEFKLRAVKLCLETDKNDAEIAKDLGVHATTLSGWKQKYKNNQDKAFSGKKELSAEEAEIKKLKKQLQIVTEEREILKKALNICNSKDL